MKELHPQTRLHRPHVGLVVAAVVCAVLAGVLVPVVRGTHGGELMPLALFALGVALNGISWRTSLLLPPRLLASACSLALLFVVGVLLWG